MTTPNDPTINAWVNLARSYNSVFSAVESALKKAGFPSLSWYDVLLELDRANPDGLRPFELQQKLLLPQYGISRLISSIEKEGYLQRVFCINDGRGQYLHITQSGKQLRKQMWRIYGNVLQETIGEKLATKQADQLSVLLEHIE